MGKKRKSKKVIPNDAICIGCRCFLHCDLRATGGFVRRLQHSLLFSSLCPPASCAHFYSVFPPTSFLLSFLVFFSLSPWLRCGSTPPSPRRCSNSCLLFFVVKTETRGITIRRENKIADSKRREETSSFRLMIRTV